MRFSNSESFLFTANNFLSWINPFGSLFCIFYTEIFISFFSRLIPKNKLHIINGKYFNISIKRKLSIIKFRFNKIVKIWMKGIYLVDKAYIVLDPKTVETIFLLETLSLLLLTSLLLLSLNFRESKRSLVWSVDIFIEVLSDCIQAREVCFFCWVLTLR